MKSVGTLLRTERERQGRTTSDAARELNIMEAYLVAIEDDQIQQLPGLFFYKNFTRQYGRFLALDADAVTQGIAAATEAEASAPVEVAPVLAKSYAPPAAGIQAGAGQFFKELWDRLCSPTPPQRTAATGGIAMLLILTTAGVASFVPWGRPAKVRADSSGQKITLESTEVPDPPKIETEAVAANALPETSVATPASSEPAQAEIKQTAAPAAIANIPGSSREIPAARGTLKLTASEMTWFSVANQGRIVYAGVLQAGESKEFTNLNTATLRLGNAAGIQAEWNGEPSGSLGGHGEVRSIHFTAAGIDVATPGGQL